MIFILSVSWNGWIDRIAVPCVEDKYSIDDGEDDQNLQFGNDCVVSENLL